MRGMGVGDIKPWSLVFNTWYDSGVAGNPNTRMLFGMLLVCAKQVAVVLAEAA
jgi:hypothetical protein